MDPAEWLTHNVGNLVIAAVVMLVLVLSWTER